MNTCKNSSLRLLTLADLDRATLVISQAFRDDPLWCYLFPDRQRRVTALPRFFGAFVNLGIRSQQAYRAGDPLEGVAIWSAPQKAEAKFADYLNAGFPRLIFSPLFFSFFKAQSIFTRFEQMQKRYAPEPHYYLNTIGVLPEAQGKGLASQLIKPFLTQADAQGVSVYTETMTPSNVTLYEHYGFKVVERYNVPNTELSQWAFYRPVQGKST
ncbi:MAG: GNAT family N-acetyltransferase [Chloroflexi bacterium]|nr:GNAT family N-acetyltransferase [Chloroflexota bacterium]